MESKARMVVLGKEMAVVVSDQHKGRCFPRKDAVLRMLEAGLVEAFVVDQSFCDSDSRADREVNAGRREDGRELAREVRRSASCFGMSAELANLNEVSLHSRSSSYRILPAKPAEVAPLEEVHPKCAGACVPCDRCAVIRVAHGALDGI